MRTSSAPVVTGPDVLGRYYTNPDVSRFLVDQLIGLSPIRVLDLGAGSGSLSKAALLKWRTAEIVTVDVDKRAATLKGYCQDGEIHRHKHVNADALSNRLPDLIGSHAGDIDVGVCNPPFIIPKWRKGFGEILEEAGFSGCLPSLVNVDAALLFLAQNLRLLGERATLGIILPDSLISSAKYRGFRRELLNRYHLERVIRLPRRSFSHTDALAYILIIGKKQSLADEINLLRLSNEHVLSTPLTVCRDDAIDRLDFEYHANRQIPRNAKEVVLETISRDLRRGSLSSSESRVANFPTFHTTDMTESRLGRWVDLRRFGSKSSHCNAEQENLITAAPGDILIARIGRNLENKVLGVAAGFPIITDCVLRLRVPKEFQETVLTQLAGESGKHWLASRAYGVSAKQISKPDVLSFPVSI